MRSQHRHRHSRPRARTQRGGARTWTLLAVGIVVLGIVGATLLGPRTPADDGQGPPVETAEAEPGPMTEAERVAYVKGFVRVDGLEIGPDMGPSGDTRVPGLLRVKGSVVNAGERAVDKVVLTVFPQDAGGEVIAVHVEDVAKKGGPLGPGQTRAFAFTIPDKKAFEGAFDYELR